MEVGFSYAVLEAILAYMYKVPDEELPKLRARYRKLQALGVPSGDRPKRGQKKLYSPKQLAEIVFCLELAEVGLEPKEVVEWQRRSGTIDYLEDQPAVFIALPNVMSRSWAQHRVVIHNIGHDVKIGELFEQLDPITRIVMIDYKLLGKRIENAISQVLARKEDLDGEHS